MPRYRIHQTSYIDDRVIDAGQEIEADARHVPGPHWEPLDDAAKALAKKHSIRFTGNVPDPTEKLSLQLNRALESNGIAIDHDKLGAAIAQGLAPLIAQLMAAKEAPAEGE